MDEDDFNLALLCGEDASDAGKGPGGGRGRDDLLSSRGGKHLTEPALSDSQRRKLSCFFSCYYDRDKDGFITVDDLNSLAEVMSNIL
jgi:hypothetical protein